MNAEITSFSEQMMMGEIYRRSKRYLYKLDKAINSVRMMLDVAPQSYVSISFGKQSICVAHMVQQIKPDIPMFFLASTETWSMYDYVEIVKEYQERFKPNLTIVQTDRLTDASSWKAARDAGDRDLQNMVNRKDWDGWFWGLSMDESPEREKTLRTGTKQRNEHPYIFRYADGKRRCCPIMEWDVVELAAYIKTYDLPLLNIYKKYGLTQRTTARITKKMARNAGMALARHLSSGPNLSQLMNEYPEIKLL